MTAVTFLPGEEEAVPPSRSRRGFMLPTLPSKFGERETAPPRKAPTSSAPRKRSASYPPPARKAPVRRLSGRMGTLRAALFQSAAGSSRGGDQSPPQTDSHENMGPAPEADNAFRRSEKNTVSRSHPRRRQTELLALPPSPKRRGQGSLSLPSKLGKRETAPRARLRPFPPGFRQPPFRRPRRTQTAPAVPAPVRASRLSRAASSAFPGPPRPAFCRLKTKHRKGESRNLLPFGVF